MNTTTNKPLAKLDDIHSSTYLSDKNFLIFDIETTGFSRENEIIYMIGCIFQTDEGYDYRNMFAEDPSKEGKIIGDFFDMLKDFDCIIHFNGNRFDIPFLLARAAKYQIKETISKLESIDIYDLIRPFRKSLDLPNLKLDTLQEYLGYTRKDTSSGGELIPIYHAYTKEPYKPYYDLLLLHNKEDVEGMINLLPVIDLIDMISSIIWNQDLKLLSIKENPHTIEVIYQVASRVLIDFKLSSKEKGQVELAANSDQLKLTLPLYQGEKKFFFENYKDYVYLPEKDDVIHKSIGSFIPAHQKTRALKSKCYASQEGVFLPALCPAFIEGQKIRLFQDDLRGQDKYILFSPALDHDFYKQQVAGLLEFFKGR